MKFQQIIIFQTLILANLNINNLTASEREITKSVQKGAKSHMQREINKIFIVTSIVAVTRVSV